MTSAHANPYADLEPRAFWRSGVADRHPLDPGDLYRPKFAIPRNAGIMTAGSCFAQHVGRRLRMAGMNVLDSEPLPGAIPDRVAQAFGYRLYSARYGNIYTARQLWQLVQEAEGLLTPALPVWEKAGRFFDAQRPGIEPDGFATAEEVLEHRQSHLADVAGLLREASLFVFTFGLTEAWIHRETGTVYPTVPGSIAGSYDPEVFAFKNFDMLEVLRDFSDFRRHVKGINPGARFLVTVSPVPLTATASGQHVEVATVYSKSVLRAVCGKLAETFGDVDYFPSYEIITSINNRGVYYEANKRSVSDAGVETAMGLFLRSHGLTAAPGKGRPQGPDAAAELVCEEALLEAFAS